jgi:trk system potassium uptake protein TrkH
MFKEIKLAARPNSVYKVKLSGRFVEHEIMRSVNVFAISLVSVYVVSMLLLSLENHDFTTNFTAVAATINNIGPGLGKVGPMENFSVYSPFSAIVLSIDMLIGRLEIFPIIMLFSPSVWRGK